MELVLLASAPSVTPLGADQPGTRTWWTTWSTASGSRMNWSQVCCSARNCCRETPWRRRRPARRTPPGAGVSPAHTWHCTGDRKTLAPTTKGHMKTGGFRTDREKSSHQFNVWNTQVDQQGSPTSMDQRATSRLLYRSGLGPQEETEK